MEENKKEKKKFKKFELFIIIGTFLIVGGFVLLYGNRLYYYYYLENPKIAKDDKRLITYIFRDNKTVIKDDGLYQDKDNKDFYTFKGSDIKSNYVFMDGRLYRIINIKKDSVTLIADKVQTSIAYGKSEFEKSNVYSWLNDVYLKSIENYESKLVKSSFCTDQVELDNLTCEQKVKNYVGLLSIEDYLNAGGKESFLNNKSYFYTSNFSKDGNPYYVFDEGGINSNDSNLSYGIRPVIEIKNDLTVYSGNGTKDKPYYLDENNNTIVSSKPIGSYIDISGYKYRIISKEDKGLKLLLDDVYTEKDKKIKKPYDEMEDTLYTSTSIKEYLNGRAKKLADKDMLGKCTFNIGPYETNYKTASKKNYKGNIGLPSVGDFFTNNKETVWLSNNISEIQKVAYTAKSDGTLYADSINNKNYIRPVLCVDNNLVIVKGLGLENDPFVVEVDDETNN